MESKAKGNKLFQAGKHEEAIRAYSAGIDKVEEGKGSEEDQGGLHLLYANRSMAHLELALVDEALQDAELCIDIKPDFGKGYLRRALVLLDLFKNQDAVVDLDKAEELEPGLAPEGCEARRRAAGEVWVDNCYLKEHKRLKKKLGRDYVVIGEFLPGEFLESDPTLAAVIEKTFGDEIDQCPVGQFPVGVGLKSPLFAKEVSPGLLALSKTREQSSDLYRATIAISRVLYEALSGCDVHYQVTIFGMGHPFIRLVLDQLKREYGSSHTCKVPNPVASTLGYDSTSVQCFLWHCVNEADSQLTSTTPVMFPGAPKWVEFDDAATHDFLRWVLWEVEGREKEVSDWMRCRKHPPHVPKPKGGVPPLAKFAEHRQQLRNSRSRLEQRDHRCRGCGIEIKDPDPPECLCGAFYCSFLCHAEYKASHQEECRKTLHDLRGPSLWTAWYWRLVLLGYYPFKNEMDPVAEWKSRNINVDDDSFDNGSVVSVLEQEFSFYNEVDLKARDEARALGLCFLGRSFSANAATSRAVRLNTFGEETVNSSLKRYTTPILTDTIGRIWWKYMSYENYFPVDSRKNMELDTAENQLEVIHFRFLAFAEARWEGSALLEQLISGTSSAEECREKS